MPTHFYDEMYADSAKTGIRPHYTALNDWLAHQTPELILDKRHQARLDVSQSRHHLRSIRRGCGYRALDSI